MLSSSSTRHRSAMPSLALVSRVLFAICAALLLGGQAAIAFGQTETAPPSGGLSPVAFVLTVFGAVIAWLLHRAVGAVVNALGIRTTTATLNALDAAIAQAIGWAEARIEPQAAVAFDAATRRHATVNTVLDLLEIHFDPLVKAAGLPPYRLALRVELMLGGAPTAAPVAPVSTAPQPGIATATAACLMLLVSAACLCGCSSAELAAAQQDVTKVDTAVLQACADYQTVKPGAVAITATIDPKSAATIGTVVNTADTVCAALTALASAPADVQ